MIVTGNQPVPENLEMALLRQRMHADKHADEERVISRLLEDVDLPEEILAQVQARASVYITHILQSNRQSLMEAMLSAYPLNSNEGRALMCLAEALLRISDRATTDEFILDVLRRGDWRHARKSQTNKSIALATAGLELATRLLKRDRGALFSRLLRSGVRFAMRTGVRMLGRQFVMAESIGSALRRSRRRDMRQYQFSYDMLGEAARTGADAERYFQRYRQALLTMSATQAERGAMGISVKLSALHPRYEFAQRQRVMDELVPRLTELAKLARQGNLLLTVDAEEASRLDLSLDVISAVLTDEELSGWAGFGVAVQAYQKRAPRLIEWLYQLACERGCQLHVRLVKGAYWDSEIKVSQQQGHMDYPVYTRKPVTDMAYLHCAWQLLQRRSVLFPQFATHNAWTVAAILALDDSLDDHPRQGYEFQRLHGMGKALFDQVIRTEKVPCRVYAPVGAQRDLLAYLVRRLLENGANSSFVNLLGRRDIPLSTQLSDLLQNPIAAVRKAHYRRHPMIPQPRSLYHHAIIESGQRDCAIGVDLNSPVIVDILQQQLDSWWLGRQQELRAERQEGGSRILNPANRRQSVGAVIVDDDTAINGRLQKASEGYFRWSKTAVAERATCLRRMADRLELSMAEWIGFCVREAGKTLPDAVADVREAIDFCRYYSDNAESLMAAGEYQPRGVVLCISPWNFPLAIFLGQVSAALVTGNTVLAKPAQQTSLIARAAVDILWECGVPESALQLVVAPGPVVGERLLPDQRVKAVMFTGSCDTARSLARTLAQRPDGPIPLVAETGGQNAMIVDSTALPEQVVDDVIHSAFHSAGQRCSALRVLFVQEEIAPALISMLKGAMDELTIGDPMELKTDVGPVIDASALSKLYDHVENLTTLEVASAGQDVRLLHEVNLSTELSEQGYFFAPRLYELATLDLLQEEVFGPVVHLIRYPAGELDDVMNQIRHCGYGLTLGVHSRIRKLQEWVSSQAPVGNVYINRAMTGAVVGVQPFGGRGLSGTGPKAGGPFYLRRLVTARNLEHYPRTQLSKILSALQAKMPRSQPAAEVCRFWSRAATRMHLVRRFLYRLTTGRSNIDGLAQLLIEMEQLLDFCEQWLCKPVAMPGPSGEDNSLQLEPRGKVLLLVLQPAQVTFALRALLAAFLAGDTVLLICTHRAIRTITEWQSILLELGMPADQLQVLVEDGSEWLSLHDTDIRAVVMAEFAENCANAEQILLERQDGLIPLITDSDPVQLLLRLTQEKTVSINTAADGGDTSLLSMA